MLIRDFHWHIQLEDYKCTIEFNLSRRERISDLTRKLGCKLQTFALIKPSLQYNEPGQWPSIFQLRWKSFLLERGIPIGPAFVFREPRNAADDTGTPGGFCEPRDDNELPWKEETAQLQEPRWNQDNNLLKNAYYIIHREDLKWEPISYQMYVKRFSRLNFTCIWEWNKNLYQFIWNWIELIIR